jgi:hypothetical protein
VLQLTAQKCDKMTMIEMIDRDETAKVLDNKLINKVTTTEQRLRRIFPFHLIWRNVVNLICLTWHLSIMSSLLIWSLKNDK